MDMATDSNVDSEMGVASLVQTSSPLRLGKLAIVFTLIVDYSRSLKDLIAARHYDYVNNDITQEHFPVNKDERGKKEQTFTLYYFNKKVKSDYAIAQMQEDDRRPATLRAFLAFDEANPELHREFPIIALGSVWVDSNGFRSLAYLNRSGLLRGLGLDWYVRNWDDHCHFLAVNK